MAFSWLSLHITHFPKIRPHHTPAFPSRHIPYPVPYQGPYPFLYPTPFLPFPYLSPPQTPPAAHSYRVHDSRSTAHADDQVNGGSHFHSHFADPSAPMLPSHSHPWLHPSPQKQKQKQKTTQEKQRSDDSTRSASLPVYAGVCIRGRDGDADGVDLGPGRRASKAAEHDVDAGTDADADESYSDSASTSSVVAAERGAYTSASAARTNSAQTGIAGTFPGYCDYPTADIPSAGLQHVRRGPRAHVRVHARAVGLERDSPWDLVAAPVVAAVAIRAPFELATV